MIDNENYIALKGWMLKLKLTQSETTAFALVWGFCQTKDKFTGSLSYVADWLGMNQGSAYKVLTKLVNRGLLTKHTTVSARGKSCSYSINREFLLKALDGYIPLPSTTFPKENTHQVGTFPQEVGTFPQENNNIDNKIGLYNNDNIPPIIPRGSFGQSENCPAPSTPENFKNFSVSVSVGNTPLNTTAVAVSEKEKSSARKEKENQLILGGLFGGELQLTAPTQKTAKNGIKNANAETAEVFRGFWNQLCVPRGFAEVKKLNKGRIAKVATLVKELQEDGVSAQALFDKINNAVALYENRSNGGEDGSWFSFDWLIQGKRRGQMDTNWKLIMSGRYDRSFRKGLIDKRSQSAQQMQRSAEFLGTLEKEHPELSPLEMLELIQKH